MSAITFKQGSGPNTDESRRSWFAWATERSTGARLIELGKTLADAEFSITPGLCFRCRGSHDPQRSTAQYPNVFCSEHCEQEFIRTALAALTLQDCVRMHRRLETLLMHAQNLNVSGPEVTSESAPM